MTDWNSMTTGLGIVALIILYFTLRKPMAFEKVAERNRTAFTVTGDPKEVLDAAIAFARQSRYRLASVDEAERTIVLEEGISLFNFGALFKVAIKAEAAGQSTVHVATVGRGFQWGPAFQRSKRAFLAALQAALVAHQAK